MSIRASTRSTDIIEVVARKECFGRLFKRITLCCLISIRKVSLPLLHLTRKDLA